MGEKFCFDSENARVSFVRHPTECGCALLSSLVFLCFSVTQSVSVSMIKWWF